MPGRRFAPLPPSSLSAPGATLSFEVPSYLSLGTFLAAPIFAAFSADGKTCPIAPITFGPDATI